MIHNAQQWVVLTCTNSNKADLIEYHGSKKLVTMRDGDNTIDERYQVPSC